MTFLVLEVQGTVTEKKKNTGSVVQYLSDKG